MTRNTRRLVLSFLLSGLAPALALAADREAAAPPPAPHHATAATPAPAPKSCSCSHAMKTDAAGMGGAVRQAAPRTDPDLERDLDRLRSQPG